MPHSLVGSKRPNRALKHFRNLSSSSSWIPVKDSDGVLGTDRIVRRHKHKMYQNRNKHSSFDKNHIPRECFGNIFLEMTKRRFHPKSNIQSNCLESPEESQASNCGTQCQRPTITEVRSQSSLHKPSGDMGRLQNPIGLKGIFFMQVALIEAISNTGSG